MLEVPRANLRLPERKAGWQPDITMLGVGVDFRCPNGHIGSLVNHEIARNGVVTPSIRCPRAGCAFHEYVRLLDWP